MMFLVYVFAILFSMTTIKCSLYGSIDARNIAMLEKICSDTQIGPLNNPFQRYVLENNIEHVKRNISSYSNKEMTNHSGQTILHMAVIRGYSEMVEFLISEKGDCHPDTRDFHDQTALHWACRLGFRDVAITLVSKGGADIMLQNLLGKTPLFYCTPELSDELYHCSSYKAFSDLSFTVIEDGCHLGYKSGKEEIEIIRSFLDDVRCEADSNNQPMSYKKRKRKHLSELAQSGYRYPPKLQYKIDKNL